MNSVAIRTARFGVAPVTGYLDANDSFHADRSSAIRSELDRLGSHLSKNYINGNMAEGLITHKDDLMSLLALYSEYVPQSADTQPTSEETQHHPEQIDDPRLPDAPAVHTFG